MDVNSLRILELFSGIGGMHYAFKYSGIQGSVIAAVDINPIANTVYKHNFLTTLVLNRNIQNLSVKQLEQLNTNTILMSPPCQPFTRVGNQEDLNDPRTDAFKYICHTLLPSLNNKVQYILMENVKGFEKSEARDMYIKCLQKCGFYFTEFILSPTQFGIPNTRYRYYCLARRNMDFDTVDQKGVHSHLDCIKEPPFLIKEILENENALNDEFLVPENLLRKRLGVFDIVTSEDLNSCCFTKAYTHYCEGTGSVYSSCTRSRIAEILKLVKEYQQDSNEYIEAVRELRLRYFTSREVCRLMSFPEEFTFPPQITSRQKYKLLGNSINVRVVGELLKILFSVQ